jgi:FIST N domain
VECPELLLFGGFFENSSKCKNGLVVTSFRDAANLSVNVKKQSLADICLSHRAPGQRDLRMLHFDSAQTRMVDSCNAVNECLSEVMVRSSCHGDLVLIHASLGHNLKVVTEQVKRVLPHARVLAASCCGVVGREGVSETMKDLALMAVSGREFSVAHLDGIYGHNSFECGARLAKTIKSQNDKINIVYWMASGIDIDNSACIAGIESVLGEDVTIVGATSSDNIDRAQLSGPRWMLVQALV